MGRNHKPDCHTDVWTGTAGYKVYDPFCPLCQEDRRRVQNWTLLICFSAALLGLLGVCCGVYVLIKGIT